MGLQANHGHRPGQQEQALGTISLPTVPQLRTGPRNVLAYPVLYPRREGRRLDEVRRPTWNLAERGRDGSKPNRLHSGIRLRARKVEYVGYLPGLGHEILLDGPGSR
jgi:hypothetical protein